MPEYSKMGDTAYADHYEDNAEFLKSAGFEQSANEVFGSSRRIKRLIVAKTSKRRDILCLKLPKPKILHEGLGSNFRASVLQKLIPPVIMGGSFLELRL